MTREADAPGGCRERCPEQQVQGSAPLSSSGCDAWAPGDSGRGTWRAAGLGVETLSVGLAEALGLLLGETGRSFNCSGWFPRVFCPSQLGASGLFRPTVTPTPSPLPTASFRLSAGRNLGIVSAAQAKLGVSLRCFPVELGSAV